MKTKIDSNSLVPGQVNHDETEASQVLGNNNTSSGNGEPQRADPTATGVAARPSRIILAASDALLHLLPGMFTANVAQGLDRAGLTSQVRSFGRVLNGGAGPEDTVCVPPQASSANAGIITLLAHRPQRTVIWAPGKQQCELLDEELTARPPRVCVLPQKRVEEVANCRGECAMYRLSRWMRGICLVSYALDGAVIVPASGAHIAIPGYDLPVVDPEGVHEAFIAGLVASLACDQGIVEAATVGLAQMASVASAEGAVTGFMTLKQAAEFIREQAPARHERSKG